VSPIALLVDLDGVIRRWSNDDAAIEKHCGLPIGAIRRIAFSPEFLLPAISGAVTDEAWRQNAASELHRQYPGSSAHEAIARWSTSPGELEPGVLAVLSCCRPDLRVVLATNATSRLASDLRALGLSNRFYAVANSSELGAAKPSVAYFQAALRCADVRSSDALFVDDSLSNVQAAAGVGMLAHHFTGHEAMSSFLRHAGVLAENAL
jgi:putative hydrolase of the HAD superfamily